MPENTSKVPMVLCPKCGHLLPELPRYSVYRCGGCGGVLRAETESSVVTHDLSENARKDSNDARVVGVDRARDSKSPMRSRYPDATRKSPMRERNSGGSNGHSKSPMRGRPSKSPLRSRDGDANRKSPMRERSSLDGNRKSPLRGRMSADLDAKSKSSGRSTDGDLRKSPLRRPAAMREDVLANLEEIQARDKVGAWVEHGKEEGGYVNKLVLPTESFNGWLPGEPATDQNQIELNKSSASPRKRRTWSKEDAAIGFDLKQRREQIGEITDPIDDYDNIYVRRHEKVIYDDLVEEDDYEGARRNTDFRNQDGYVEVFERSRGRMRQWEPERIGFRGVHGNDRPLGVGQRVPVDRYGPPSNYHSGSYYGYDNRPASHPNAAMEQAELLRKFNELGEQLHRISDLPYNQGRRAQHGEFYGDPDDYLHDEFLRAGRGAVQSSGRNGSPRTRQNYYNGRPVQGLAGRHHEEDVRNFHPRFMPNELPFYDDPSYPQIPQMTTHRERHYYQQQIAPRQPMDSTYEPRTESLHHLPPKQYPVAVNDNKRHPVPNSRTHQDADYNNAYGKRTTVSNFRNPTPNNLSSNSRSSVDSKSDGGSLVPDRSKRVLVVGQNQQLCHPIAGGAPFVTCSKCSQLLKLPVKLRAMKKNQCRLQCGSCHTVSSFDFYKKKSDASVQTNSKPDDTNSHHSSASGMTHRESFDLKKAGYTFPTSDSEPGTELEDRKLNSMRPDLSPSSSQASKDDKLLYAVGQTDASFSKAEKPLSNLSPSSSLASKDDKFLYAVSQSDASSSKAEKPLSNSKLPLRPPPGSPLRYHLEYSDMLASMESGNKETYDSSQNKLDLNSDEILRTDAPQDSIDSSVRKDQGRNSKGRESPDVFVNGQQITLDAVRSAERLAGPISSGEYWYDKRAGFWGVMGGRCLGIIAPFIQEFKAPMPENCSDGDTCIYVNGRELHKNDLDLLSGRGLPFTRYKYYIVDLAGKVEDEDTGRFVVNLGKLAPNVEKSGRGFGMQPPEIKG